MKTYNTNSANPTLVAIFDEKIKELLKNGQLSYENLGEKGVKEVGRNAYIDEADEEKYSALNLLYSFINLKKDVEASSLYEFPGFTMDGKKMRLVIPVTKGFELADKAKYLEEKLSDYGVKFPAQLYQLSRDNRGKNMPGKDFPPPVPKTMDTTDAEYENYLEEYYKAHGIAKESDGLSFRKPYVHEQVEYGTTNKFNPNYTNEAYKDQLEIHAKGKGKTVSAPVGEKLKVRIKSLASPELKAEGDKVKTSINWKKIKSNAIKIAAVGAGVVGATVLLNANPIGLTMLGAAVGIGALARYVRNKYRKKKLERQVIEEEKKKKREEAEKAEKAEKEAKEKEKEKEEGKGAKEVPEPTPVTKTAPTTKPKPANPGTSKPGSSPAPASDEPIPDDDIDIEYDLETLAQAEEDLRMDNEEFTLTNNELTIVKVRIAELEGTAVTDEQKQELLNLKAKEIELMKRRLEIAKIMVGKQQIMLDNFEHSARKR